MGSNGGLKTSSASPPERFFGSVEADFDSQHPRANQKSEQRPGWSRGAFLGVVVGLKALGSRIVRGQDEGR